MSTTASTIPVGGRTLTQAERTAISDRAMLDAAIDLILKTGIEKTTLAAIGEQAGYSRGLATYRFGSKAGLFDAVCKSISHRWLDYLREDVGDKIGIEAMSVALDSFFTFVTDSPDEARVLQILYCGAASPESEYRQTSVSIHQRQQDDVAEWVRAAQSAGSIRTDVDPQSIATQYIAYISGMTYLWVINPASIDFQKANNDMKRQLETSLATNGSNV
ncbi:MAG: TetR/AcrR family transcriptional regulator [Woeseiaceae bacterium]